MTHPKTLKRFATSKLNFYQNAILKVKCNGTFFLNQIQILAYTNLLISTIGSSNSQRNSCGLDIARPE